MKTILSKTTSGFILAAIFLFLSTFTRANTGINEWYGNQNFNFEINDELINVHINKNPWESFTLAIDHHQLMENPVVQLEIASDQDIVLRVDISDGAYMSSENVVLEKSVKGTGMFYRLNYDFSSAIREIELSDDAYLIFYVNPGKEFTGKIAVKRINFSGQTATEKSAEIKPANIGSFSVYPSPATGFTNVSIPDMGFQSLRLVNASGSEICTVDISRYAGQTYRLDLSGVYMGYYLVQLVSNGDVISEKLIVN